MAIRFDNSEICSRRSCHSFLLASLLLVATASAAPPGIDWAAIRNPILDTEPEVSIRDPLLVYDGSQFRVFYSMVRQLPDSFDFDLGVISSADLVNWSAPRRLTDSPLNFSSPGSVTRIGGRWVMALQSYPIPAGQVYASDDARLWLMDSADLETWSAPRPVKSEGCTARWAKSPRQIDPCLVEHNGRFWSLYKTQGQLGLLVSDDLTSWSEALPQRPVIARQQTPDGHTVENPSVIRDGAEFVMFFARVGEGRGVGVARSRDLLTWTGVRYLDFPELPWAGNGPSAPMVLDLRERCGKWVMVFHGDRVERHEHGGALGIAWSKDLEHWIVP